MRFLVSVVTWVLLAASAGCGRTHVLEDAGRSDADPTDAVPHDASRDATMVPLPPCSQPASEWAARAIELGGYGPVAPTRYGGRSAFVAGRPDGRTVALVLDDGPIPAIESEVELELITGAFPIAAARDAFRVVTLDHVGTLWVHDSSGARMSRESVGTDWGRAHVALRSTRIGLAFLLLGARGLLEVRDVAGGPAIVSETHDGIAGVAIGEGRGLFALVTDGSAGAGYWGLDELGAIRATDLGGAMREPGADGTTFAGSDDTDIRIRFAGGRIEARRLPGGGLTLGLSVADGPHGAVVAARVDGSAWLSLPDGSWRSIAIGPAFPHADQGSARVGAFFAEDGALRWAGLSCAP